MSAAKFQRVKVMGERGTGTNFVSQTIHANFDTELLVQPEGSTIPGTEKLRRPDVSELRKNAIAQRVEDYQHATGVASFGGWKHACLTDRVAAREDVLFVCVLRHPAPWSLSLHKLPFSTYLAVPDTLEGFLAQPWITRPRDEIAELILDGPAVLWRMKTESYLNQAADRANVVIVQHEQFLKNYISVMDDLRNHLVPKDDNWKLVTSYGRNFQEEGPDYWQIQAALPEDPWTLVSSDAARILRTQIGTQLIQRAGYAP